MRNNHHKTTEEILFSQLISITGCIIAGSLLAVYIDEILIIPGLFLILPGFLDMRGSISESMAARLTSGLFLGVINPKRMRTKLVKGNVLSSFILAIIVSLILGFIAFIFNFLALNILLPKIILIPLIAGFLANLIEIPATLLTTFYFFKRGNDPNDIMGPFVKSIVDVISITSLILVVIFI